MGRVDDFITGVLTGGTIEEMALSSKHMRIVAGEISKIEDPDVRQQVANHFSTIFSKANPRFDHNRFSAAASGAPNQMGDFPRSRDNTAGGMTRTHFQQSADMLAGGDTDLGAGDHIERIHSMMNPAFKSGLFRSRASMQSEGFDKNPGSAKGPGYFHPKPTPERRPTPSSPRDLKDVGSAKPKGYYHPNMTSEGMDEGKVIGWMKFDQKSKTGLSFEPHKGKPVKTVTKPGGKGYTIEPDVHSKAVLARKDEGVDEAEIPMNYSFKRKERGPGMVATSQRVELDAQGRKQNVTKSEIVKFKPSATGDNYGLWKSHPAGSPERPAGVRPAQPTQRLTPPGGPNAQTNAPKRPSTPSWHSEAPKPYRPTESLADKARRVVDEYVDEVRVAVREALSKSV